MTLLTRRDVSKGLLGLAALGGQTGCGQIREWFQPKLADGTIDIHAHIFNGRDVPVIGFLQQTFLRDPHGPVDPDMVSTAFFKLIKTILLINTPTARQELADINRDTPPLRAPQAEERDQRNVAQALGIYAAGAAPDPSGFTVTRSDEARILDRLAFEIGQSSIREGLLTPQQQAMRLAEEIFARGALGALTTGTTNEYRHHTPLVQTVRWAGMLTRSRRDVLGELQRLYGGEGQVRVFAPSIVDFTYWFKTDEPEVEPVADQIEVVSAVSRTWMDALILPFAPFCPLRAALEREDHPEWDALRNVKTAVLEKGFAGIKLYPPMGFKPWGNSADISGWAKRAPQGGGPALDRELEALYVWCVENDVPIKAHANNSIDAGPNTGTFASPEGWRAVLEQQAFRNLRVNLAHFGDFDETRDGSGTPAPKDWEAILGEMIGDFPELYFDLGFWDMGLAPDTHDRLVAKMSALIDSSPLVTDRMMYGSDWSMIGRVPGHQRYSADVQRGLRDCGLDERTVAAVMGGNAGRYLGAMRDGAARERLKEFHGDHPIFQEVFGT